MPDIAGTADAPLDHRRGGEEPELQVSLVGVSCVGTTTIGRIPADRRGWPFFDLDNEIERHFGLSIERLQYLTAEERVHYLKEIKADISYFKRSYERADLQVTITGLDPQASAAAIDARLGRT